MRCPDCNKFVSYSLDEEPEENGDFEASHENENTVKVTGEVDRPLNCADCGTELKRGTLEFDIDVTINHTEECEARSAGEWVDPDSDPEEDAPEEAEEPEYEVEVEFEPSENTITDHYDKRLKKRVPNKSSRYNTQEYGVAVHGTVTCQRCGASGEFAEEQNMAASSFDEQV